FASAYAPAQNYEIPEASNSNVNPKEVEELQKISRGISTIAKHAQKGIVFVSISKTVRGQPFGTINPFDFFFGPERSPFGTPPQNPRNTPEYKQQGLGSGFFIDLNKGYILTNNHVIEEADEINLKLANGETYAGTVVGRDKNTDVAVVQI